jgi:hypothetical protein
MLAKARAIDNRQRDGIRLWSRQGKVMFQFNRTALLPIFVLALSGCDGARPMTGGTQGHLHSGAESLSEIQVTVHQFDAGVFKPIGFGVPGADGAFRLLANGASGPLFLPPGEYRCTLESIGAPVEIPREYWKAETSPLKIMWSGSDQRLDIDIPQPKPIR